MRSGPPYRVLHVIGTLDFGGAERTVTQLVRTCDQRRFLHGILCLYRGGTWAEELAREGLLVDVLGLNPRVSPANWRRVGRALRSLQPVDVVHAHLPDAWWFALPWARALGVPVRVAHAQNWYPARPHRFRLLDRYAVRISNAHVIACSSYVRARWVAEYRTSPNRVTVALNAVDLDAFANLPDRTRARIEARLAHDGPIVLCVASLTPQKGHDVLLKAWAIVTREFPEARLVLVGDGALRRCLEITARQLAIDRSVTFLGPRRDVPVLFAASDVVVLASKWEGLPLVLAEAAAAGRPVVASDVGGIPEIVEDAKTGLLVPPGDAEGLAHALRLLLRDGDLRARLGLAAQQKAQREFGVDRLTSEIERIYLRHLDCGSYLQ